MSSYFRIIPDGPPETESHRWAHCYLSEKIFIWAKTADCTLIFLLIVMCLSVSQLTFFSLLAQYQVKIQIRNTC